MKHPIRLLFVLVLAALPLHTSAQTPRIDPAGIDGALLLCGSYKITQQQAEKFVELAGGKNAKIVILTFDNAKFGIKAREPLSEAAKKLGAAEPIVVDYSDAAKKFPDATGLWMNVDSVSPMPRALADGMLAQKCAAILKKGGVIASAAAGTRYVASKEMARNGAFCMRLLPDSLVDLRPAGKESRLPTSQASWKGLVAYELDPNVAMLVKGRTISTVGEGTLHIHLPAGSGKVREIALQGKSKEDLTTLRRALFDRVSAFPPKEVEAPVVAKGTLVIVGGGGQPDNLYKKFVEYAGGEGKANIVIFPTANDPVPKKFFTAAWEKAGAKKVTVLAGRTQAEVESKEFLDTLKEATGLWFDGGRQWRFVDCYENTKALPLMHDVLKRGGVIGGTSAGATIQGDYLCRGGVFNNFDIRYEGYERGLGFLKGVAIDQHFSKRNRLPEMTELMKVYPQYLGIGIDEATAIVVKGQTADVIGKGKVFFYDARRKVDKGQPDYEALSAGERYDLKERKVIQAEK